MLLQKQIDKIKDPYAFYVKVVYRSGVQYKEIVDIAIDQVRMNMDNVIYILGEMNNITHRV